MTNAGLPDLDEARSTQEVLLRPIREGNAFEDTVNRLLQTIRLGVVAPGEALPAERDLATRFGVSRDTVRDAIRSLAEAGYVESRRGRYGGTFVCETQPAPGRGTDNEPKPVSAAELADILGLREILEVGAARSAAARSLTATEREELWSRLRAVQDSDPADYRRFDSQLHLYIGELVGAPSLLPVLADNRMRVNILLDDIPLLERNIAHSNQQHEAIVIAILTGQTEQAAAAMAEHLAGSAALLRGFLG